MKLTMLGTGHAMATKCYNTCFVLREGDQHFLVDGGGGNGIFRQLQDAGIRWEDLKTIFVTHKHVDHVLGIVWMMRKICASMSKNSYPGEAAIFAHAELIEMLKEIAHMLLQEKEVNCIGRQLHLVPVVENKPYEIIGHKTLFFDIQSKKAKQYGFTMYLDGNEKLTCCGDEPYRACEKQYVSGSKWLLHEAFCLHSQVGLFAPYEKHHSTVKDACQLAERLQVRNLLLYHTEDSNLHNRKKLYREEGANYFGGGLYIPDDLEVIEL